MSDLFVLWLAELLQNVVFQLVDFIGQTTIILVGRRLNFLFDGSQQFFDERSGKAESDLAT